MSMSRHTIIAFVLVLIAATVGSMAVAQDEAKFSVQFEGVPLPKVLEALKRFDAGFSYTLPASAEMKTVTASLVDVTVEEALAVVLEQVDLRYVKDNNIYSIREKPVQSEGRGTRPMPTYGASVVTTRPTSPGAAVGAAGVAASTSGQEQDEEEEKLLLRLIKVKYANLEALADLFGGDVFSSGDYTGSSNNSNNSSSSSSRSYGNNSSSNSNSSSNNNSSRSSSSRNSSSSSNW